MHSLSLVWLPPRSGGALLLALVWAVCSVSSPVSATAEALVPAGNPLLLQDVNPGAESSGPRTFGRVGDVAVFTVDADPGRPGPALWRSDGTPGGTLRLDTPGASVNFINFVWIGSRFAWFPAFEEGTLQPGLWRTDGTPAGTIPLANGLALPKSLAGQRGHLPEHDRLVFTAGVQEAAGSGEVDWEPWVSDGTPQGTKLLKDVVPDGPSMPFGFQELSGELYFAALEPGAGHGLWATDGTSAGTRLVTASWNGAGAIQDLWAAGSFLYLSVLGQDGHLVLWRTDGTSGGTLPLRDFGAGAIRQARPFTAMAGGRTLFTAWTDQSPPGLWLSDGTPGGTRQLMPLAEGAAFTLVLDPGPAVVGDRVYFLADDGRTGRELWRTDGTPQGTKVAFESCPGQCSDLNTLLYQADDRLVVLVNRPGTGFEPWISDGSQAGTDLLADLCPGVCSSFPYAWQDLGGVHLFALQDGSGARPQLWMTDLTADGSRQVTDLAGGVGGRLGFQSTVLSNRLVFAADDGASGVEPWALPLATADPPAPGGSWLQSTTVPGFEFKVRITGGAGAIAGVQEPSCIPETVCVSGALPGRSEVFLRVVGPKPNGRMWPTLVKFSTSTVEVWVRQVGSGEIRYYRLDGASPGVDELPGLFDRAGFSPLTMSAASVSSLPGLARSEPLVLAAGTGPTPPATVFTSEHFPGFRFRARISAGDQIQEVRKEAGCIEETLCLSGAIPGRSEVFLRIVGPKPNGRLWPTIVKFTTSTLEVWIEQVSTGEARYYRIERAAPGQDDLNGLFDREGFQP